MDSLARKLTILADSAKYDASCSSTKAVRNPAAAPGICHSYTPDGRCVSLLKILLTNYCIYDCAYCVNRVSNDLTRARFDVDNPILRDSLFQVQPLLAAAVRVFSPG